MADYASRRATRWDGHEHAAAGAGLGPGKRTLTEMLPAGPSAPVQRKENAAPALPTRPLPTIFELFGGRVHRKAQGGEPDPEQIHASAQGGMATAASPLPHAQAIQQSFGRHDISSIQAHAGEDAAASARDIGAEAYAAGNHIVLGRTADLFTVAHEAAHVVQQRGGVQVPNGVGTEGDPHEQHANEVASRVTQSASAEDLLDRYASSPHATGSNTPVQRVELGAEAELDTRTPSHHVAIAAHLDLLDLDALGLVREALDPAHPLDRKILHEVELRIARTQGLETIAEHSNGDEVWTMAAIFIDENLIKETPPVVSGAAEGEYSKIRPARGREKELEISKRDSEVGTIDNILACLDEYDNAALARARQRPAQGDQACIDHLDLLQANRNLTDQNDTGLSKLLTAQFSRVRKLRIVLSGTAGPCDGCKARLETLVTNLKIRYQRAFIRLEVNYLGFVDVVERDAGETSYGYPEQRPTSSATNRPYYSKEL